MISRELLDILVCPENHMPLRMAGDDLVERLNAAVRQDRLVNRGGGQVAQAMEGGLLREDGRVLYPIIDGIPVMLVDESIALVPADSD